MLKSGWKKELEKTEMTDFVFVDGGEYDDDFYISKELITNAQFCEFLNDNNDKYHDYQQKIVIKEGKYIPEEGSEDLPVIDVSFFAAKNYAKWKSKIEGRNYRLPTVNEYKRSGFSRKSNLWEWTKDKWENSVELRIIILLCNQTSITATDYRMLSFRDFNLGFRLAADAF